jgi:hypothetical protein
MAGLVPAIHVLLAEAGKKDVDARDKRGHDGDSITPNRFSIRTTTVGESGCPKLRDRPK